MFSVSRRTPENIVKALSEQAGELGIIGVEKATPDEPSAHLALMADADALIVTEDSVAMLTEAVRLKRPLSILRLPLTGKGRRSRLWTAFVRWLIKNFPNLSHKLGRLRLLCGHRDLTSFHEHLYQTGAASDIDHLLRPPGELLEDDGVIQIESRLRALMS